MRRVEDEPALAAPDAPSAPAPRPAEPPVAASFATPGPRATIDDFADLVADVAHAIEESVPSWRVRLGEAAQRWQHEGFATEILERALRLAQAPDVEGLLATYAAAVARLRALEADAVALDPAAAGQGVFRDPARVGEAQALVARLRREGASRPPLRLDPEAWVRAWPDVTALLVE